MEVIRQRFGGRYELIKEIGAGGMGRVFETTDLETGRTVATKVMIATGESELQALLRFQQEGAVLATLSHPNIVSVYGTFLEDHACAIVMEWLDGESLRRLLDRERPSLAETKEIVLQVLSALTYAHGRGIVHRDIKPDNIMLLSDGRVKVTDFGLARVMQAGVSLNTSTGTTLGTPLYMSPEQIEGGRVDGRSDLYGLGVVLYQMVTGRPPFEGDEPLTIAFKHVHKAPEPPRRLNLQLPAAWDTVILRALAKHPGDRFQTAASMREAVESLSTDVTEALPVLQVDAEPDDGMLSDDEPTAGASEPSGSQVEASGATPSRDQVSAAAAAPGVAQPAVRTEGGARRWWVALGGAAALLALVVVAVAFLRPQGSSPGKPVPVVMVAPAGASLAGLELKGSSETGGKTVRPTGTTARLSLPPGRYAVTVGDGTAYLDDAEFTVRDGASQTVHLDALYGKLILQPPAGRITSPGFDLEDARTGKTRHGVATGQGSQGVYVRPGRYRILPWPSDYVVAMPVTVRAHQKTTLNLARRYGRLTVVQLAGAPPSGVDLVDPRTRKALTGFNVRQGRQGVFVPAGHFRLYFYYSDVYPDQVGIAIAPGGHARVDLNKIFTGIRTPKVATDYSVTYTWRSGGATDSIQAGTKPRTYYVRAGTYRMQIDTGGSTRVTTIHAPLGRITTLPTH